MKNVKLALIATFALTSAAFAQTQPGQSSDSNMDKGAATTSGDKTTAPKTTGAMNNAAGGVATSPQDVQAQQKGQKTAAEGGGDNPGAPKIDEKQVSPGTVGAAPGGDNRR